MNKNQQSNNDRSNALNPNNPTNKTAQDNRANQLNPNSPTHQDQHNKTNQTKPKGK